MVHYELHKFSSIFTSVEKNHYPVGSAIHLSYNSAPEFFYLTHIKTTSPNYYRHVVYLVKIGRSVPYVEKPNQFLGGVAKSEVESQTYYLWDSPEKARVKRFDKKESQLSNAQVNGIIHTKYFNVYRVAQKKVYAFDAL